MIGNKITKIFVNLILVYRWLFFKDFDYSTRYYKKLPAGIRLKRDGSSRVVSHEISTKRGQGEMYARRDMR